MDRNILELFDKIEKNREAIIAYRDKPILVELDKNQNREDLQYSAIMGILIDVEPPIIYLKQSHYLDENETYWEEGCFDDFLKLDPDKEDYNADPPPALEFDRIHAIYASKDKATAEQVRDMWLDPQT